jgi:hypothetical protein
MGRIRLVFRPLMCFVAQLGRSPPGIWTNVTERASGFQYRKKRPHVGRRSEIQTKRGAGYPSNRSLPILRKMNPRSLRAQELEQQKGINNASEDILRAGH